MLYKNNKNNELDNNLFLNPTKEYRGAPFWAWNCELDIDDLKWQIEQLKKMGFGGAHMHSRTGMATKYLSPDFMNLIKECTEKFKSEDMLSYLYDEDRWPSGAAGGIVTKDVRYAQRFLTMTTTRPLELVSKEESYTTGKPCLLKCYDIILNEDGTLESYKCISENENAIGTKWYCLSVIAPKSDWHNGERYLNTLSGEAVDKFIDVTYETYKKTVGDDFGKAIPSMFTDEPQIARKEVLGFATDTNDVRMPWVLDFPKTFEESYNENIMEKLPEVFWNLPNNEPSYIRYCFHDHLTQRFENAFFKKCGEWCEKNKILFTGHLMEEASLHSQTSALGEAMRLYRYFGLPGIDMLCDWREFSTAKQAQSVSCQYGKEGVMSELYGVTNWDFDFRGHKFQGDWQAALGITLRVPHLSWVSMKGEAKRDYPASINYQSAWYEKYKYVEDHFSRLNTALTRGKLQINVGVIHPVESYWINFGPNENTFEIRDQLEKNHDNVAKWLLFGMVDYNYISESLLIEQYKNNNTNEFFVGEMNYKVIVVPALKTMRETTYNALCTFKENGGKIIFMGDCPKYIDAKKDNRVQQLYQKSICVPMDKNALLKNLEEERQVLVKYDTGTSADNLIYQLRNDNDCQWCFIAHAKNTKCIDNVLPEDIIITLYQECTPLLYDTINGEIKEIEYEVLNNKTVIKRRIYANDSLLLKLVPYNNKKIENECYEEIFEEKRIFDTVKYELSEENVLLMDMAEYSVDDGEYYPLEEILRLDNKARQMFPNELKGERCNDVVQPWVIPDIKTTHTIKLKFEIETVFDLENSYFALEDSDIAEIELDGKAISKEICGYFTDKSIGKVKLPKLTKGTHTITVKLPLGDRTNTEWCYLLGDFNVKVEGAKKTIIEPTKEIGFGDITKQGLAFYGGNITYKTTVKTPNCDLKIHIPHYKGAVIDVKIDGEFLGNIAYAPYEVIAKNISKGDHLVEITLYATRINCFGSVHCNDDSVEWYGPDCWRTKNDAWCYEYVLKPQGIMSSPVFFIGKLLQFSLKNAVK